ncbi:phosphoadenylyl-sulfate reductase [Aeromicrobium sp. CF3.5]|uniref:phosphoadenylyl-sulfate reductase n=1 Tax=Aeromicrobium sp. CF3.5 TaxID=3373078 RepID=UPI003EE4918F
MTTTRRDPAVLQEIAEAAQQRFTDATADEVLAWAGEEFGRSIAVACSMAGDTVLPHLVSQQVPGVDVLFLETGYHFAETRGTRAAVAHSLDVNVVDVLPELTVAEQDAQYGAKLHDRDPAACCAMRKVEPLNRSLAGYEAWVTGVRREDNALRADTQFVEWDAQHEMVKINPIALWSFEDVLDYGQANDVPVNPLLSQGYPSIGCEPCTRRVAPGEDPRAGRWAGLTKTECGIHT